MAVLEESFRIERSFEECWAAGRFEKADASSLLKP